MKILDHVQKTLRVRVLHERTHFDVGNVDSFDYLKLAARCRTQNMFNRLHIELENVCTPRQLVDIAKLAETSGLPPPTRTWLKRIGNLAPDLFTAPQGYERRPFSSPVIRYQNPEYDVRDKSLLVAFSTNARRLMMPVSVFLQNVDSRRWDVVVLKKGGCSYLLGLEGISTDFGGLVAYVQTAATSTQYRRVITLGTSVGGYAAILAALLMCADRGISICGCLPSSHPSSVSAPCASHGTDLCFVYGTENSQDHRSALALLDRFGGRLRPVPEVDRHGALGQLLKAGQLREFLSEMLV